MTTINTTEDLLSLLRENQEFREAVRDSILTEELLTLPAAQKAFIAEIREFVTEIRNYTKAADRRLLVLEEGQRELREDVRELKQGQQTLEEGQRELRGDVRELKQGQQTLEEGQRELRGDVRELKQGQQTLEEGQRELRGDVQELRGDVQELKQGQQTLERGQQSHTDDIGELKGIGLETKLYNRGVSLIATLLRVHNGQRVRVAEKDDNSADFNSAVLQALEDGFLTEEEYDRILDTDMIISGSRTGSSNPVYTAIEASYSISRADISKVKETATVLSKVFHDADIHAALYYMNIASVIEKEAVQQGVHLIKARNLRN